MQLPVYQSRVTPPGPQQVVRPAENSAYEGVIQFAGALKNMGGTLAQAAINQEKRVRAQTMDKEVNEAWRDYLEMKTSYSQKYFSPDTAYLTPEGEDVPNYILGQRKLEEEFEKFYSEVADRFTYSEALQSFRLRYEQDMVGFGHTLTEKARGMHLAMLRHDVETSVNDFTERGDSEMVVDILKRAAENGTLNPMEAENLGNASLKQIHYNFVTDRARDMVATGASESAIMEKISELGFQEYEDYNGENRKLGAGEVDQIRSTIRAERNAKLADEQRQRAEDDRMGNEEAQRMYRDGSISHVQFRAALLAAGKDEGPLAGLSWSSRERWLGILDSIDERANRGSEPPAEHGVIASIYGQIRAGTPQPAVERMIYEAFRGELINETQYRTLVAHNASRNVADVMSRGYKVIEDVGKADGRSVEDITIAKIKFDELLRDTYDFLIDTETGGIALTEKFDQQQLLTIARNFISTHDWDKWIDEFQRQGYANPVIGDPRRADIGEIFQYHIDNLYFLGLNVDDIPEFVKALNYLEAGQGALIKNTFGVEAHASSRDPLTHRLVHSVMDRRGKPIEITFRVEGVEKDNNGRIIRADERLYVSIYNQHSGRNEWRPMDPDVFKREVLGILPPPPPPRTDAGLGVTGGGFGLSGSLAPYTATPQERQPAAQPRTVPTVISRDPNEAAFQINESLPPGLQNMR